MPLFFGNTGRQDAGSARRERFAGANGLLRPWRDSPAAATRFAPDARGKVQY